VQPRRHWLEDQPGAAALPPPEPEALGLTAAGLAAAGLTAAGLAAAGWGAMGGVAAAAVRANLLGVGARPSSSAGVLREGRRASRVARQ
jgi:hypothetical protein